MRLFQVIVDLQAHPELLPRTEMARQSDRGIGTDGALGITVARYKIHLLALFPRSQAELSAQAATADGGGHEAGLYADRSGPRQEPDLAAPAGCCVARRGT